MPNSCREEITDSLSARSTWFRRFSIRSLLILVGFVAFVSAFFANQESTEKPGPTHWDLATGKNIKWRAELGSTTYSNPVPHGEFVFIGTNNQGGFDPDFPSTQDCSIMLCLDRETGKLLWQHTNQKLAVGRVEDWPFQGVTSTAKCEKDRLWYVNNRGQIVCLDTNGFHDDRDDGLQQPRERGNKIKADVVWVFDMRKHLGVCQHNISHSNVAVDANHVYANTSNGVDQTHSNIPNVKAPSFVAVDRKTGKLVWSDNSPGDMIYHGSWGSPTLANIGGKRQVIFGGGDGWLYSFDPSGDGKGNSKLIWKFDCNPKTSVWKLGGTGTRNSPLTAATVHEGRVFVTLGQDPEHGTGPSRVWCIEPGSKTGDISRELVVDGSGKTVSTRSKLGLASGEATIPNPNSAAVWEFTGANGSKFGRSLSRLAILDTCAYVTELNGYLYCLDVETGKLNWRRDLFSSCWTTPMTSGGHVFVATEDGFVVVFPSSPDPKIAFPKSNQELDVADSVYANPLASKNGVLYIANRKELIAIQQEEE